MKQHETVGAHIVGSVLHARAADTAGDTLRRLLAERPASVELVLVVDAHGRLAGVVRIGRLLALETQRHLSDAIERDFPRVQASDDQEHAASLALHNQVDALPVVDATAVPLGVMPSQALLQVLRREHVEDLHRLAGIQREASRARHAIEDPPLRRVRHRLPWLLVGLAGSAAATAAMASMEASLRANVAIAFFVPALVYLADAIGTQTEAIAVRGLSLTRAGLGPLLFAELRTGALIGAILGLVSFVPVWLVFDAALAGVVAASILVAGAVANGVGLLFPWALQKLRFDPAYGTGPASTVVQDVSTIVIYVGMVKLFAL